MADINLEDYMNKAEEYARDVVDGKEKVGKYVKLECIRFLDRLEQWRTNPEYEYYFDYDRVRQINKILKLLNFATGVRTGEPLLTGLFGFQFFILHNIFCWRHKVTGKRLIREVYLEIARKNGKNLPSYNGNM